MAHNPLKISHNGGRALFVDNDGDELTIDIYSTGETTIQVRSSGEHPSDASQVLLSNRAAHELRDMLNRRFPNATAVQ